MTDRKSYLKAYKKLYRAEKRTVSLTVSADDYKRLVKAARAEGKKPTTLLHELAFTGFYGALYVPEDLKAQMREMNFLLLNIANNVNQLAHWANTVEREAEYSRVLHHIRQLHQVVADYTADRLTTRTTPLTISLAPPMIIKSMSRKTATFSDLVAYVDRVDAADHKFALRHNMHADSGKAVVAEFESNGRLLKARKNGVVMYHEIISITRPKGLKTEAQKQALRRIAHEYVKSRAPRCMAYGMLHDDHSHHLHYHLVISANENGASRRHSLTRQQFRSIQIGMEKHVLANYPQLEQTVAMNKSAKAQQSQAGIELKRRTGRKPQVEVLKASAALAFKTAQTPEQLFSMLTDAGLELYQRGKSIGLRDLAHERNHRLETLGLMPVYQTMHQRFSAQQNQQIVLALKGPAMKMPSAQNAPVVGKLAPNARALADAPKAARANTIR